MKILVTGVAGFIGAALTLRLLERGDEVVGIDNLNDYYDINLKLARIKLWISFLLMLFLNQSKLDLNPNFQKLFFNLHICKISFFFN